MPMQQICNTSGLTDGPHYINDHTLVQDEATGKWHLFGIFHHEPVATLLNELCTNRFTRANGLKKSVYLCRSPQSHSIK